LLWEISSCAGTKSTSNVQEGSANSVPTLSGSSASERPRGQRGSSSHRNKIAKKAATSSLYEESGEDSLSGYESTQSDHVKASTELNYVLSDRCYLTAEQEEKIAALVKKIQPDIPVLVAQLKKSNVKNLNSNLDFNDAAQYLPDGKQVLTLRRRSRAWCPNLHNRLMLATGEWREFARDSRLEEGDLCLF
ncbi:hypothetical protein BAE44_0020897, partial [Dichanthelium oligosanthes]